MLLHTEPELMHKLFQHEPDYYSHATLSIDLRLKVLFLALINHFHVPLIMRYLTGNYTAS